MSEATEAIQGEKFVEVNYDDSIPNNVNLSSDKQLLRALESWHPNYIDWWKEMGPEGFQEDQVFLRTAVSVDHEGWAHFDYVKMPDYRWGIFLTPEQEGTTVNFGEIKVLPLGMKGNASSDHGTTTQMSGGIVQLDSNEPERAEALIEPTRNFDVGEGKGRPRTVTATGGIVGIIIDARGRPLALPTDETVRIAKLKSWLNAMAIPTAR